MRQARLAVEKDLVLRALQLYKGNASAAANAIQVTRRYFGSLMEKHDIELRSIKRAWAAKKTSAEEREAGSKK